MGLTHTIGKTIRGTLDELFPSDIHTLPLTDKDGQPWQPDDVGDYCPRCGASSGLGAAGPRGCPFCHNTSILWQRIIRLGSYSDPLDRHSRDMKFAGMWKWAHQFGNLLAQQIAGPFDPKKIIVCPVAMHWMGRWHRGYNQAQLMAHALATKRNWPVADLLRRIQHRPPQTAVPVSLRAATVRGSLAINAINLTGYEVIIVDDVKTTGATLASCVRLLRHSGAASITAAVAAVADPHDQDFTAI
jgi:ComF family protein